MMIREESIQKISTTLAVARWRPDSDLDKSLQGTRFSLFYQEQADE